MTVLFDLMNRSENILVYRLGSLGDTIMALPAFHGVRRAFPGSNVTLLTNRPVASKAAPIQAVLGMGAFFDEVLEYPVGTRSPATLFGLIRAMRSKRLDTAVNLAAYRSDFSTIRDKLFFQVAGINRLVGFDLKPRDKSITRDRLTGETEWEARRIARRIEKIAPVDLDDPANWDLCLSDIEINRGLELLAPWNSAHRLIAFSTGTKVQAKHWGSENWKALSERLSRELPEWRAVFLGSAEEAMEAQRCAAIWEDRALNLCGAASPRESAAVLSHCRLFVGHDSGPMHLAACMGVPCVAIFSGRNLPRQWFPRGSNNRILQRLPACAGCGLENCLTEAKKCLTDIPVDEVAAAVLDSIKP
jgi:ADP-heptose:LPS heptosyltransferase